MRKLESHKVNGANETLDIAVTDAPGSGGANHRYEVTGFDTTSNASRTQGDAVGRETSLLVLFQNGPVKEAGVNGITQEALLAIVADRLESFQAGPYACSDNSEALASVVQAMQCLQRRTKARIARGVEGTHTK